MTGLLNWLPRIVILVLLALVIFGPLTNLLIWAVAEQWYFPHKLPVTYGFKYWMEVFKPTGNSMVSLWTSLLIAVLTVLACLAVVDPGGLRARAAQTAVARAHHARLPPAPGLSGSAHLHQHRPDFL